MKTSSVLKTFVSFLRAQYFVFGIIGGLAAAFFFPERGVAVGELPYFLFFSSSAIFFCLGVSLKTEEILPGLKNTRLHLSTQTYIFILVPLLFQGTLLLLFSPSFLPRFFPSLRSALPPDFLWGIRALSVLPTTLSSAAIMTLTYKGNLPGTIVNSTLSNIVGIIICPFLLAFISRSFLDPAFSAAEKLPISRMIFTLLLKLILPLFLGQCFRFQYRSRLKNRIQYFTFICQFLLILVIFVYFSRSVHSGAFGVSRFHWGLGFGYLSLMYLFLLMIAFFSVFLFRFPYEDGISFLLLSSQKTLVAGVPLLTVFFAFKKDLSLLLLPLIFYHPWQLFSLNLLIVPLSRFLKSRCPVRPGTGSGEAPARAVERE